MLFGSNSNSYTVCTQLDVAYLRQQQCHNSNSVIFQEKFLKVLKCY